MPRYVETFPLPKMDNQEDTKHFEILVDQIIENKKDNIDTKELENEIDQLVYQLYELTEEEIEIIENSSE